MDSGKYNVPWHLPSSNENFVQNEQFDGEVFSQVERIKCEPNLSDCDGDSQQTETETSIQAEMPLATDLAHEEANLRQVMVKSETALNCQQTETETSIQAEIPCGTDLVQEEAHLRQKVLKIKKHKHRVYTKRSCEICQITFTRVSNFYRHYKKFHPALEKPAALSTNKPHIFGRPKCNICQKQFTRGTSLRRHFQKFHPFPSYPVSAPPSDELNQSLGAPQMNKDDTLHEQRNTSTPLTVQGQERSSIEEDQVIDSQNGGGQCRVSAVVCEVCNKSFTRMTSLRRHYMKFHTNVKKKSLKKRPVKKDVLKQLVCKICQDHFSTPSSLHQHQTMHASSPSVNVCQEIKMEQSFEDVSDGDGAQRTLETSCTTPTCIDCGGSVLHIDALKRSFKNSVKSCFADNSVSPKLCDLVEKAYSENLEHTFQSLLAVCINEAEVLKQSFRRSMPDLGNVAHNINTQNALEELDNECTQTAEQYLTDPQNISLSTTDMSRQFKHGGKSIVSMAASTSEMLVKISSDFEDSDDEPSSLSNIDSFQESEGEKLGTVFDNQRLEANVVSSDQTPFYNPSVPVCPQLSVRLVDVTKTKVFCEKFPLEHEPQHSQLKEEDNSSEDQQTNLGEEQGQDAESTTSALTETIELNCAKDIKESDTHVEENFLVECNNEENSVDVDGLMKDPGLNTANNVGAVQGDVNNGDQCGDEQLLEDATEIIEGMDVATNSKGNIHKNIIKPFECYICKKQFSTKRNLVEHLTRFHHACRFCDKLFPGKNELKVHAETHKQIYYCEFCNEKHYSLVSLKSHHPKHSEHNTKECEICKTKSKNRRALCEICGEFFGSPFYLREHQLRIHPKYHHTMGHKNQITKKARCMCELCGKVLSSAYHLRCHYTSFHPERKVADKYVYLESNVDSVPPENQGRPARRRERSVPGERIIIHKCQFCPKVFVRLDSLTTHLRVHTGERPFECKICHSRFTQRSSFKAHARVHSPEKYYKYKFKNAT